MCHITGLNRSDWNDTMLSDDFHYTINTSKKSLFSEQKKIRQKKRADFHINMQWFLYKISRDALVKGTDLFKKANSDAALGSSCSANAHFSKQKNPRLFHSYLIHIFYSYPAPRKTRWLKHWQILAPEMIIKYSVITGNTWVKWRAQERKRRYLLISSLARQLFLYYSSNKTW